MSEIIRKVIGNELFVIEELYDEYLITVRQPNGEPFEGDDGTPYEIRIVMYPDGEYRTSVVSFIGREEVGEPMQGAREYIDKIRELLKDHHLKR